MGSEWKTVTLGDASLSVQTGPFGSQLHKADYVEKGIPSIMPINISDNRITTKGIARITEEDAERLSKYRVKTGDIVYSRRGDVERRALVRENEDDWLCGTGCLRVRFDKNRVNPEYASFQLGSARCREWIIRHAIGATMPNLNTSILSAVPFILPPLPEQKAIAHILGSLDDKIELNRRMNATLEGMAQALFKSWFVDFDPVIDNALAAGNPIPDELADRAEVRRQALADGSANRDAAKDFPAAFQKTEELGWIPEGWEETDLPNVIDFLEGPGIRNWQYTEDKDGIKFINIRCIQNGDLKLDTASKLKREESLGKYAHFQLEVDDIVISTSGTLGRYAFVRREHLPLSLNTSVIRFKKIEGVSTLHYIAGYVETTLQSELEMRATGSAQLNFGPMHLKQIKMLLPDIQLLERHNSIAHDLFGKRQSNLDSIDTLTKLRDTLLPKLISGELRITEDSPNLAPSSPNLAPSSPNLAPSSPNLDLNSQKKELDEKGRLIADSHQLPFVDNLDNLNKAYHDELIELAAEPRLKRKIPKETMKQVLITLATGHYITISCLAKLVARDPETLRSQYLSQMVKDQALNIAFPRTPNDPRQAYTKA